MNSETTIHELDDSATSKSSNKTVELQRFNVRALGFTRLHLLVIVQNACSMFPQALKIKSVVHSIEIYFSRKVGGLSNMSL